MSSSSNDIDMLIKRVMLYKNPFDALDLGADTSIEDAQKKVNNLYHIP
jgi:methanogenic corrinoid protein MtbC1